MTDFDEIAEVRLEPFRKAVEQFQNLMNSRGALTFLIGAGCSRCAGLPLTSDLFEKVMLNNDINGTTKEILVTTRDTFAGASNANIEDYLSEIVDLIAIAERRKVRGVPNDTIPVGKGAYSTDDLQQASMEIKRAIGNIIGGSVNLDVHRDFVASVHRPIRVGRIEQSQPVDYLVLNYDTILEDALALERIIYADGIQGGPTGWWHPELFHSREMSARVIKIHGSVDWHLMPEETLPRRLASTIDLPSAADLPVLIWPSSTKYQETQLDPFAQLLEIARRAIRPDSSSQRLIVICGYSFGDSHINAELDRALHGSEGNLTVVAFTNEDEPIGQLKSWYEDNAVREQLLIFANRGFFHGELRVPSQEELLWWKFENLTRIVKGDI